MANFRFYEVGGCVRDGLLGVPTKDVDFSVVAKEGLYPSAEEAFSNLEKHLDSEGFRIFLSTPEYLTIRAQIPKDHPLRERTVDADFVLARKDGPYSDGRRPDWVVPGTLDDDLRRRDFTVNAMARSAGDGDNSLYDPFDGLKDLEQKVLRFVGDPFQRISEDGLRVARALRFSVTKGFSLHSDTSYAVRTEFAAKMLTKVSTDRIKDELEKMFRADSLGSLRLLANLPDHTTKALVRDNLRLTATLAK